MKKFLGLFVLIAVGFAFAFTSCSFSTNSTKTPNWAVGTWTYMEQEVFVLEEDGVELPFGQDGLKMVIKWNKTYSKTEAPSMGENLKSFKLELVQATDETVEVKEIRKSDSNEESLSYSKLYIENNQVNFNRFEKGEGSTDYNPNS